MATPAPLTHDQLKLLFAELADLQRSGFGEIRLIVHEGRVRIAAVTRSVNLNSSEQVQARLDELEKNA